MINKYEKELEKEKKAIEDENPLRKKESTQNNSKDPKKENMIVTPYFEQKEKSNNYFNLILGSDQDDLEMEIRGLEYVSYTDEKTNKQKVMLRKKNNHYLSDEGASDVISEFKRHVSTDNKLGKLTEQEFKIMMMIVQKSLSKFFRNNLERLGMDTEAKQRKARPLLVAILNRIWMTYSRSIGGSENKQSHGSINLSGGLDSEREEKFRLEEARN